MASPAPLFDTLSSLLPFMFTVGLVAGVLWAAHRLLITRNEGMGNDRQFSRQLIMLGLSFAGLLAIVLALPVSESSRNQVVGILGLLLSGIFAFSSSTLFTNLMSGIMLRVTKPFRIGDFISIEGYFGRVVERGLLDTEIQTESRQLVALPNIYMITHPVSVTRSSGTIISTSLSLGYDIHHSQVDALLLEAASTCGLDDPFVQVIELGDYSITYKVSGMLMDVKSLLTARSNLCRHVLDTLHDSGVEIVSPSFMNQRKLPDGLKTIPIRSTSPEPEQSSSVEAVAFDKAEQAEQVEKHKQALIDKIEEVKTDLEEVSGAQKKRSEEKISEYREQLKNFDVQSAETLSKP
jgi:small conductance mechanosensitive channel